MLKIPFRFKDVNGKEVEILLFGEEVWDVLTVYPQCEAVLRAVTELNLAGRVASKREVYKYVVENGLYKRWGRGKKSDTAVRRAFKRLEEAGLLYKAGRHYNSALIKREVKNDIISGDTATANRD